MSRGVEKATIVVIIVQTILTLALTGAFVYGIILGLIWLHGVVLG